MRRLGWLVLAALCLDCARGVPNRQGKDSDLPAFTARNTAQEMNVVLGPQGRQVLMGEFKLSPETMGFDVGAITRGANMVSGAVWCVEPEEWVADTLVVRVGISWWPPGAEPQNASRSITEALMRCLGYLDARPWTRGTVYLRPASLPRVDVDGRKPALQEGTESLGAALEHAFAFGLAAPFMVRGLALNAGTQDGSLMEEERGVLRKGEGHVRVEGKTWNASTRLDYSPAAGAASFSIIPGQKAATVVKGVSYVLGEGDLSEVVPRTISRAALRIEAGLSRGMITMTSQVKARHSPGLSCVIRTLSAPRAQNPDAGVQDQYPGVDLDAAQKCVLTAEDQTGPERTIK